MYLRTFPLPSNEQCTLSFDLVVNFLQEAPVHRAIPFRLSVLNCLKLRYFIHRYVVSYGIKYLMLQPVLGMEKVINFVSLQGIDVQ